VADARITLGCNPPTNTNFCPGSDVTRGQMAGFLTRALGLTPIIPPPRPTTTTTTAPDSSGCHPSYTGACVPIVSDVDCIGGSGNGPYYVGRVNVVGPDVYDLDRDGDGVGCET
jgi:hypothetical protein